MKNVTLELYGIQYLRAIAALLVIVHHMLEVSNGAAESFSPDWLTLFGAAGVDIFFVISGFIMVYTSFPEGRSAISSGNFLIRRVLRIYPIYWTCCFVVLAIFSVGLLRNNRIEIDQAILSFFLFPSDQKLVGVAWTLVYEMYFYLIFALALLLRRAVPVAVATTAVMLSVLGASMLASGGASTQFLSNPIVTEFLMGVWLGIFYLHHRRDHSRIYDRGLLAVAGFALILLSSMVFEAGSTAGLPPWPRVFGWGLPAVLILMYFIGRATPQTRFAMFFSRLGDASYALYLTHPFVMIAYGFALKITLIQQLPQAVQIALASAAVIGSLIPGLLVHLFVERPLMRALSLSMKRRYSSA